MENSIKQCYFNDSMDNEKIIFYSDVPQSTIDALEFNAEWHIVKELLLSYGYKIIENHIIN